MYNGRSPVTARDIALIYGESQSAIICAMHRSERMNLVRRVSLPQDYEPDDLVYATRAIVLRELAPILDGVVFGDERRDEPVEKIHFESLVVASTTHQSPRSELPPYTGHGLSYLRLVVQLAHRANVAGFAQFKRMP